MRDCRTWVHPTPESTPRSEKRLAAVSEGVAEQLRAQGAAVRRLAGATRYGTSAAVADEALERGADPATTWVASGLAFPDALVAAASAGQDQGVLLLVDGQRLESSKETAGWLQEHAADIHALRIAGGPSAVGTGVETALRALLP